MGVIRIGLLANPHRMWPVPDRPWFMKQTWSDVLFLHWPVPAEAIQHLVPAGFEIDKYDGQAWLGIISFLVTGARLRFTPPIPGGSSFPEVNLRTYVIRDGKPGVYFLSMDADHKLAVEGARRMYHLPFLHAGIRYAVRQRPREMTLLCIRTDERAPAAQFAASYRPTSAVLRTEPGTLGHFLTARYCLYCTDSHGRLYRGDLNHEPWPLQHAEAELGVNTIPDSFGLPPPRGKLLMHYSRQVAAHIWPLVPCD